MFQHQLFQIKFFYTILLTVVVVALVTLPVAAADDFDSGDFPGDDSGEDSSGDAPVADNSATAAVESLGPYGGDLWDVAIDANTGYIYTVAKESPNGFYRSTDGGLNWEGLSGVDFGGGIAVEVDPSTGDVYVVFGQGLYKSIDQGVTFTKINDDTGSALLFAQAQLIMSSNSSTGAIVISSDGGETFSTVTVADGVGLWWIDANGESGPLYIVGFDDAAAAHLYTSTNAGSSWSELTIPSISDSSAGSRICSNPTNPANLILTGSYSGTTYYSTDTGSSWTATTVQSQSCVFDSTGRVYVGEQYSDDQGATWTAVGQDDSDSTGLGGHNLTIDPTDETIIYADAMPGLSKSTDRGATWTDINEGIAAVTITDLSQADNKDVVWAAAYNGIVKTSNFTAATPTWEFVLEDPGTGIWIEPTASEIIIVGEIGAIKRSVDGGETWTDVATEHLSHDYQVETIIQDRLDSNVMYAALANGEPNNSKVGKVLKSEDMGETWTDMELLDDASAQTISQASTGELYVGVGAAAGSSYKKGIYKYSEGVWSQLADAPDEEIVQVLVDSTDDNTVYAVASIEYGNNNTENFGFYRSLDAGVTWTKITEGLEGNRQYKSLAIQTSTTPHTLYLGASNYYNQGVLYKSSDAGETWGTFYTGLQDETFYTLIFDGVTAGTSRGLFDVKSKADVALTAAKKNVAVNGKAKLTVTLKDAITDKKIKRQTVKLFKKTGDSFELVDKQKTDKKGKAEFIVRLRKAKKYTFKAQWKPNNSYSEEYTTAQSDTVRVTAKP